MGVGVLELPYIFGTQPGRRPVWVILIEQLQRFEKLPFTMYPAGGTAMLTVRQVGECIVGAAEQVQGFRAYGISCYNMHWREFLKIVYRAMDGIQDRKIVDVPKWTFQAFGLHMRKEYAKRNVHFNHISSFTQFHIALQISPSKPTIPQKLSENSAKSPEMFLLTRKVKFVTITP